MTVATCSCGEVFRDDNPLNPASEGILLHERGGHSITLWNQGCGRKLGPFDCCTVVCGDCLELMKQLPDGCVDAVITDPPYGIDVETKRLSHGRNRLFGTRDYPKVIGDDKPFDPMPFLGFPKAVLWGGNHYADKLPASPSWIIWDKVDDLRSPREWGFADGGDAELAWTNLGGPCRIIRHRWQGYFRASEHTLHVHPTQKPVALLIPIVKHATIEGETIFDPYCGCGPVPVAAKKLGRHFLGFEISPEYCEIARKRIALVEAQPSLFEKKPEQLTL